MSKFYIIIVSFLLAACADNAAYQSNLSPEELNKISDENLCKGLGNKIWRNEKMLKAAIDRKLLTEDDWSAAQNGKVKIGMSECGVIIARGVPSKKNNTLTAHSSRSQWVYGYGIYRNYIYIENGYVSAIQN